MSRIASFVVVLFGLLLINITSAFWTNHDNARQANFLKNHMSLDDVLAQGEEKCINKPCVQSEQCCPGSVCIANTQENRKLTGMCMPIYGVNEGDTCMDDKDCEPGLHCMVNTSPPVSQSSSLAVGQKSKSCQPPGQEMVKKQYNDECSTSGECDASRGLCCQLIKRHRMAPRRACLYFSDSKNCLGPVDITFAKPIPPYSQYIPEQDYFRARIG